MSNSSGHYYYYCRAPINPPAAPSWFLGLYCNLSCFLELGIQMEMDFRWKSWRNLTHTPALHNYFHHHRRPRHSSFLPGRSNRRAQPRPIATNAARAPRNPALRPRISGLGSSLVVAFSGGTMENGRGVWVWWWVEMEDGRSMLCVGGSVCASL